MKRLMELWRQGRCFQLPDDFERLSWMEEGAWNAGFVRYRVDCDRLFSRLFTRASQRFIDAMARAAPRK